MAADKEMIQRLNTILRNELTAINQYFLHAKILKHVGFAKLADYEYKESIDEMKHADALIERILFLDGLPNLQDIGKLLIGETVVEILQCDLKLETKGLGDLKSAIAAADESKDYITSKLLEEILASEEEHIDFLRRQLHLIEQIGVENYLQSQM